MIVRDPRGIMSSRYLPAMDWCRDDTTCAEIDMLCDRMKYDIISLIQFYNQYSVLVILAVVVLDVAQGWSIRNVDDIEEVVEDKELGEAEGLAVTATTKAAKATGKPGKATGKPAKAPGKPGKATGKPGKATGKPGKATGKPGKATGKPAKATGKPAKATGKPGNKPGNQQGKKPAPMDLPVDSP
ncbi:unnamed protein product [Oppiella nova]|uniref:Uncharacterized protein n=1 Tax=Oppiella nova TaxID=334625 RepID=A0A7R9MA72_9ACAR|nr:unnamed protein product [Oppiella nova]CAG2173556.1 unnamed protein product [Oppiella nova]